MKGNTICQVLLQYSNFSRVQIRREKTRPEDRIFTKNQKLLLPPHWYYVSVLYIKDGQCIRRVGACKICGAREECNGPCRREEHRTGGIEQVHLCLRGTAPFAERPSAAEFEVYEALGTAAAVCVRDVHGVFDQQVRLKTFPDLSSGCEGILDLSRNTNPA